MSNSLAHLRALLAQPPSLPLWQRFCHTLDETEEEADLLLEYLQHALLQWPSEMRLLPYRWWLAWQRGQFVPFWELCHVLPYLRFERDAKRLLQEERLTQFSHLDLSQSSLSPQSLLGIAEKAPALRHLSLRSMQEPTGLEEFLTSLQQPLESLFLDDLQGELPFSSVFSDCSWTDSVKELGVAGLHSDAGHIKHLVDTSFPSLNSLDLSDSYLERNVLEQLEGAEWWYNLRSLRLDGSLDSSHLTLAFLLDSGMLSSLENLSLQSVPEEIEHFPEVSETSFSPDLQVLLLSSYSGAVCDWGEKVLESRDFPQLRAFQLIDAPCTMNCLEALRNNAASKSLQSLRLESFHKFDKKSFRNWLQTSDFPSLQAFFWKNCTPLKDRKTASVFANQSWTHSIQEWELSQTSLCSSRPTFGTLVPLLEKAKTVLLHDCYLRDSEVAEMCKAGNWESCEELGLNSSPFSDESWETLFSGGRFPRLRHLSARATFLGERGLSSLAKGRFENTIQTMRLENGPYDEPKEISVEVYGSLFNSPRLRGITGLWMDRYTKQGELLGRILAQGSSLTELKVLEMRSTELPDKAALEMLRSPDLQGLQEWMLSNNPLHDQFLDELLKLELLPNLFQCNLHGSQASETRLYPHFLSPFASHGFYELQRREKEWFAALQKQTFFLHSP